MTITEFDFEAAQGSALRMERARKAVADRRWTDKPGGSWHLNETNTPYYCGTYAKSLLLTSDDGQAYEVYAFAYHDGSEIGRVVLKGLDTAFRRGEKMADTAH